MDLADWLRSLGLERYEAAHIEPVSRQAKTEIRLTRSPRRGSCTSSSALPRRLRVAPRQFQNLHDVVCSLDRMGVRANAAVV
jgi:hypothetical protein